MNDLPLEMSSQVIFDFSGGMGGFILPHTGLQIQLSSLAALPEA
jgi:hypothetical protein